MNHFEEKTFELFNNVHEITVLKNRGATKLGNNIIKLVYYKFELFNLLENNLVFYNLNK